MIIFSTQKISSRLHLNIVIFLLVPSNFCILGHLFEGLTLVKSFFSFTYSIMKK